MEMNIKSKFLVLLVISIVSIQNAYSSYNNKTPSMYCQYSIDSCQITVEVIGRLREFQFNIKRHNGSYYGRFMSQDKSSGPELPLSEIECDSIFDAINKLPSFDFAGFIKSDSLYYSYHVIAEWPHINIKLYHNKSIKTITFFVIGLDEDLQKIYTNQFLVIDKIIRRLWVNYLNKYLKHPQTKTKRRFIIDKEGNNIVIGDNQDEES